VKSPPPRLAGGASLGTEEEMLERHVEEGPARLREELGAVAQLRVHVDPAPAAVGHLGGESERAVDEHGPAVADEHARRDGGKAVPRREQAARLVEGSGDETPVDDAGAGLVARSEGEGRLVPVDPLLLGERQVDALRIVAAAPAGGVVMGRDSPYRSPPRSK
jgi:hypothetical protein